MAQPPNLSFDEDISSPQQGPRWYSIHQLCSMSAGALIFLSGGMSMAQGLGYTEFRVVGFENHFNYCWFIAVIVGTILSLPLGSILPKKFIMAVSSILILAGGIIFASTPDTSDALVAARYFNGLAVGLAIVPFLMHASEISRICSRGACLGIEQYSLTFGIAIRMIAATQWNPTSPFTANRLHGSLDIIFALLAGLSLIYFIESPVDYIRMGNETAALGSLARLQRPAGLNGETNVMLEEHRAYVNEQDFTVMKSFFGSLMPMLEMIFFRSMMLAFTYSFPLNLALQHTVSIEYSRWPPILAGFLRICGGFFSLIVVDKIGRKVPALLCTVTIGALMVAIAVIVSKSENLLSVYQLSVVASLCLSLQFFAGLFAPLTSAYMGEAFPLKAKSYCMSLCVIVEQAIHIIVICNTISIGNDGTLLTEGIMILVAFVCFWVTIPETKNTSLRHAQERFWDFFYCAMR